MRLFYLINGLGAGGAERSLSEMLPYFRDAGIHTTVVCLRQPRIGVESDVRLSGCDVAFLEGSGRVQWVRSLRRLMAEDRPDLVHTTLFDSHVVGRIGATGTGVPVLSSLVNTPYDPSRSKDRQLNTLGFYAVRVLDGWTARHLTTHFHAITRAVRDAYTASLGIPADRISVIERGRDTGRLGVPSAERKREARRKLGIEPEDQVLINVGRQEYQKGQVFLLEAMSELVKRRPNVRLLIAGREGNQSAELRETHARLGLGDRVRFLGHRNDVPDLLAASDVFVFPSLFEGLGGAVIEAMALGLPVVASDIPALREVVEDGRTGELFQPASSSSLVAQLDALLDSPARRSAYGERALKRFDEYYHISLSAGRMIELYRSLVPSSGIELPDARSSKKIVT